MDTLEHQCGDLEVDALENWQPVEITQDWCDVIKFPRPGDQTGCRVLDSLELLQMTAGDTGQQAVTIIQPTADESLHQCLSSVDRE